MPDIQHSSIADPNIHEPKGISSAAADFVYKANGLGSGAWASIVSGVDTAIHVATESDFPIQDASTITLSSKTIYILNADITTAKNFITLDGAVITGANIYGYKLTYTGTSTMFSGIDVNFIIRDILVDSPNGKLFGYSDTVGGVKSFICNTVQCNNTTNFGTFSDMLLVEIDNSNCPNPTQGISFSGTSGTILSINRFALFTSNSGFIGLDLGSSEILIIELSNMLFTGPSGAVGMSGLTNSGNVPAGSLAMLVTSEFLGALTPLQNISVEDSRWSFSANNPIPDTKPDAFLTMTNNTTNTVVAAQNTPVLVAGTWTIERESQFTSTTAGRATYDGEVGITIPMIATITSNTVSGGDKDITFYIYKNGVQIANSGVSMTVSLSTKGNTTIAWQEAISSTNYFEIWLENNDDSVDVLVSDVKFLLN